MRADLVIQALDTAIARRRATSVVHHSDQGSRYSERSERGEEPHAGATCTPSCQRPISQGTREEPRRVSLGSGCFTTMNHRARSAASTLRPMTGDRRPIATRETPWAQGIARRLAAAGVSPNAISGTSVAFGVGGGLGFVLVPDRPVAGLLLAVAGMQGRLLCNLFDGMVAVEGGKASPTGEIWNDLPDRLSDTAVLLGAGVAAGRPGLGALAAILALHVAYVRVLGRAIGARSHFAGPMAKQHRMAVLTGAALLAIPASFVHRADAVLALALLAVCAGCVVTLVRRLSLVRADLLTPPAGA
jgi:phosphatidylglycerophosphate synthase